MVEYVIVLSFGVLVLLGPGANLLADFKNVVEQNYRGYSYAMSLSPLPDYPQGQDMRDALEEAGVDSYTIELVSVDPVGDTMLSILEQYESVKDMITGAVTDLTGFDMEQFWDDVQDDFTESFFSI
ncbi:MAG: hypothetical protein HKO62_00325 [Gammaproteobacteria bacterium]|nr:hypothetical protein [Gammaproteobacteria bacterium]NNL99160.1 hypothetical protein [Gammaproteobacteria bacterium]